MPTLNHTNQDKLIYIVVHIIHAFKFKAFGCFDVFPGALSSVFVSGLAGAALAFGFGFSSFLPSFAAAFAFAFAFALGSGLAAFEGLDSFAGAAAFDFLDFAGLQPSQ